MAKEVAIKVKDLHKSFRLPKEHSSELKQAFINLVRGKKGYDEQKVIKGISFDIEKGDFVGIVGRNGSGKSTLLKLLAGVYTPDKGAIEINGSLVPFIELGVGFNPELTGRENVYMNGAMLGFSNSDVDKMYNEIVDFAELHEFMDQKLKNYSSGMQVRLAFSIAIRAETDILLLDEVLAVGDEAFQRKCFSYFAKIKKAKRTVILVTHSMNSVQQFCNKAVLIDKGHKLEIGNPADIAQIYRELNNDSSKSNPNTNDEALSSEEVLANSKIKVSDDSILINIGITPKVDLDDCIVSVFLDRDTGEQVYRFSSDEKTGKIWQPRRDGKMTIDLELQNIFPVGIFSVRLSIKTADRVKEYFSKVVGTFEIINTSRSDWDVHWKPKEQIKMKEG